MHLAINATFWNQTHTGSGQYTRQLVLYLNMLVSDLQITLIFPATADQPEPVEVPVNVRAKIIPNRPGHLGKVYFEQILFPRACGAIGADIAHVPYWGAPLQSPVPLVVTVHDLTTYLYREYRRGLRARLYNALVSASTRAANQVITDSKASMADIVRYLGIPKERVAPIYLAPGPDFKPEVDLLMDMATAQKYKLPEEYVLYLGGYELHKNVITLLKAYRFVYEALGAEYPLVLAGKKPEKRSNRFPDYHRHISQLGLEEIVHWAGYIDDEDKPAIYRGASSFAFLSRHEGFGLPPLEAMACGVPVVASNTSSLPEVLGSAGYSLDPDDDRQIGGAIISTIVQEELAADLRRKGLEQAANFSWEKTATETLLIYDRLLGA